MMIMMMIMMITMIVTWANNDNNINNNKSVGLANRHQVRVMQVTSLQTGFF